jgi:glycosyltransferase involved in cell wall biosynthesis
MSPNPGGIGQSIRSEVDAMLQMDSDNEYVMFYASTSDEARPWSDVAANAPNASWVRIPVAPRALSKLYWPILGSHPPEKWTGPLDILRVTSGVTSVPSKARIVVTVHDLFPELYPHYFKWTGRVYRKFMLSQLKRKTVSIIAISQATADSLSDLTGIPHDRIDVIHLGKPLRTGIAESDISDLSERYSLPEKFMIFLGRIDPRKNIETLIRAYARLIRNGDIPHHLVLAGSSGWQADRVEELVRSLGLDERVHFLGYVPDSDVQPLIRQADLFVYPSLCEGFGLPLLEAMECDTPVAGSNTFSIPEIGGDAVAYFDPENSDDMANVIREVLTDEELRARYVEAGRERLKMFSWDKTARETLDVYEKVFAGDATGI